MALLTWQYPWLTGLKTSLSGKDDNVIFLQECGFKNQHVCTYPLLRSFWGFGLQAWAPTNRNCALGWASRPERFLRLRVDCSLRYHIFTLRVRCLLYLPLTWISSSWISHVTLDVIIKLFSFHNKLFTFDGLIPLSLCSTEPRKDLETSCFIIRCG